jgi:hypothetical protein
MVCLSLPVEGRNNRFQWYYGHRFYGDEMTQFAVQVRECSRFLFDAFRFQAFGLVFIFFCAGLGLWVVYGVLYTWGLLAIDRKAFLTWHRDLDNSQRSCLSRLVYYIFLPWTRCQCGSKDGHQRMR